MADAGAGVIVQESELTPALLANLLREWLQSRAELCERAKKARALAKPESLSRISEVLLEQAGVRIPGERDPHAIHSMAMYSRS